MRVSYIFSDGKYFLKKDEFILDSFQFINGEVLNDVNVEYYVKGTPKYDSEGNITNAIVFCHRFYGDKSVDEFNVFFEKAGPFDLSEYFFIKINSLGFPESCSPSTTGLRNKFPKFTILDCVNFKRQFLKEKFGINHIKGIMGHAFGGYETLTWACTYPNEMDFIIAVSSACKTSGYRYVISKSVESIIELNDDIDDGIYSEKLSKIMMAINKIAFSNYVFKKTFQKISNDEIDYYLEEFAEEALFDDFYDYKFRNDAILKYDVEDQLDKIKAKTLLIGHTEDLYHSPEFDIYPMAEKIKGSKVIISDSKKDFTRPEDYGVLIKDVMGFLDEL